MKSRSTKQVRGAAGFLATARVLIVMAMACGAFVLLSASVAEADPIAVGIAPVSSSDAARPAVYGIRFDASGWQLRRWQRQVIDTDERCAELG